MFIKRHLNAILRCIALAFLILVQLFIISALTKVLHHSSIYVYILIEVIGMLSMLPLLADSRNSAYKIFWLLIILLIPIGGHIIYALWGEEGIHHKQHSKIRHIIQLANKHQICDEQVKEQTEHMPVSRYLANQDYPAYDDTNMEYFGLGEDGFARIFEDLSQAKKFIFISFFVLADGCVLEQLKRVLIDRAKDGVEIRLMYDDAGSILKLSDHSLDDLLAFPNVKLKRFNQLDKNFVRHYFQYRNHQKIVVVDGNVGYTGAIYINDEYINRPGINNNWKGSAVRLSGKAVWSLSLIFLGTWGDEKENYEHYSPTVTGSKEGGICQPYADGPANNEDNIAKDVYFLMAAESRKILYIATPLLNLDDELSEALALTAKAGVDVRIVVPGNTKYRARKLLNEVSYGNLLRAGVRIYEYDLGLINAKFCLNDHSCKIGTVNLDFRSFYLHYECGTMIYHEPLRKAVLKDFMDTLEKSREVTYEEWLKRPCFKKIVQMFLKVIACQF
ncbi:MAG: PLDc N-terminal domain-containing protein [Clostridium sp.]|nr:PLDc N-terminal domain-containing protein [Clostridium sp.]